ILIVFIHLSLNYTFIINRRLVSLERLGEAHALVADVVDLAVLADEGIAHDPRGTETERLEALDGEDARIVVSLDDHVDGAEGVGGGADDEVEVGDLRIAVDRVQLPVGLVHSSGLGGDLLDDVIGRGEERRAGVGDDLPSLVVVVVAGVDGGQLELVVGGGGERLVGDDGAAVVGIDGSVGVDAAIDVLEESLVLEPHGEQGHVDEL
ncbi:hypothetical protein PFISCL1PPCAC_13328, partial [Pristionchus fissidentatus]